MSISRRRFITIAAGAFLAATPFSAFAKPAIWHGVVLGADAKLVITGMSERDAKRLIQLALKEAERLENLFSIYRPESEISRLNKFGFLDTPSPDLLSLLSIVDQIHTASGGFFDPTIQPLWAAYAEHGGHPSRELIEQRLKSVGWEFVHISSGSIVFEKPDMAMTLNGIAQGFITDRIVHILKGEGLQNAIVKMGEISVVGHDEMGQAWDVGIANSGDDVADDMVQLSDQSIASSSASGTTFDGKISHILNPQQGVPARDLWQRVSAVHKFASIADGISTAAILMEERQIVKMLEQIQGVRLLARVRTR